jgi:hypothetical protein
MLLLLQAGPNLPIIPHVLWFWALLLLPPAASAPLALMLLLLMACVAPVTQLL